MTLIEHFRHSVFIVEIITIGLFFFPWLPKVQGGFSGWNLALRGKAGAIALFLLLIISTRNSKFIAIGALSHIVATALIFAVMIQALPGTTRLELRDTAPIIIALLLLANTVIVLLLWNQLQKQERYSK